MKPKKTVLRLTVGRQRETDSFSQRLSLLLPVVPVFLGLWGLAALDWGAAWQAVGLCAAVAVILLSWERAWQRWTALGLCAAAFLACLLGWEQLTNGLAALVGNARSLLTQKTGYYYPPYETSGMNSLTAALLSLLLGVVTGAAIRYGRGLPHFLCVPAVLLLCLCGIWETGVWLALYLAGTLLLTGRLSGGTGRPLAAAALLLGLVAGVFAWVGVVPDWHSAGIALSARIHALRYEPAPNPMPEGRLENLGPFSPGREPALEVSMDVWSPLYIRGFVGGTYTEGGWEPTDTEALAERAGLLYALQRDRFSPATQMGAAAASLDVGEPSVFSIQVLDACRACAYVPYGADGLEADACALLGEGLSPRKALSGDLYSVADSYLIQADLAAGMGDSNYTDGEAAYRDWVYEQFLTVPEETYRLLSERFVLPAEVMTTAQARQEVQALLDTCLTYDERAVMSSSGKPFLEYLLTINPRGYSVQYATLTTLLMRCCGIPARYVEGYLLPQRQIEGAEPGEALVLTQENSHAWTEIYLDGVGWIPFDTTPNHKEEITYAMPTGGGSQELSGLSQTEPVLSQTQQREIPIQQERRPDTGSDSGELPIWLLWMLPALVLLLLATRALLLRGRLRRRIQAFSTGETRAASLDCLRYAGESQLHKRFPERNLPITRRGAEITALLAPVEEEKVEAALALGAELCFSDHGATESHRRQAMEALDAVLRSWNGCTPWPKRVWARWIQCIVI